MFRTILHASDGSAHAAKAFALALQLAKRDRAELHLVAVEEISYLPNSIEEIREDRGIAARRFHTVLQEAKAAAEKEKVKLETHLLVGHPVRAIVDLVPNIGADLLVIGATGHSAFYERMIGSRADRLVQLAPCAVLVVK